MAPRCAVEPFHNTAFGELGPVVDSEARNFSVGGSFPGQNRIEGAATVEFAGFVESHDCGAFAVDC